MSCCYLRTFRTKTQPDASNAPVIAIIADGLVRRWPICWSGRDRESVAGR